MSGARKASYKWTKHGNDPFYSNGLLTISSGKDNVGGNGMYSGWIRYVLTISLIAIFVELNVV